MEHVYFPIGSSHITLKGQQEAAGCQEAKAPQSAILAGNPITEHTTASHLLCCQEES